MLQVSYISNFFEINVEQESTKKELKRMLDMHRIVETDVFFKFKTDEISRLLYKNENDDFIGALKVLHSKPDENITTIRKRYKKLLVKYHPDNVYREGSEKIKEYTEIFKNLQLSFEIIQNQNGRFSTEY